MKKLFYILLFFGVLANAQNMSPWDYCQDGNPIGGGPGYNAIITTTDPSITHRVQPSGTASATVHIYSTPAAFRTFIQARTSGDVVFLDPSLNIDLTSLGSSIIGIAGGVTIASDRGNGSSEGAFLYTSQMKYAGSGSSYPVFRVDGNNVRITGFTFRGPYGFSGAYSPDSYDCPYGSTGEACRRVKFGITSNYDNTEIDNMHGYNWPFAFIGLSRWSSDQTIYGPSRKSIGSKIHHNYIHNNLQNGSGYGVDTENTKQVEIYANVFHSQRHDIQNSGEPETGYEAYCNTVISEFTSEIAFKQGGLSTDAVDGTKVYAITADGSGNTTSYNPKQTGNTHHNFDVHPRTWCDGNVYTYGLCDPPAGNAFYVHHNDFRDDGVARHNSGGSGMMNVAINGLPDNYGRVEYNRTVRQYLGPWTNSGQTSYFGYQLFTTNQPNVVTYTGNVLGGATPPGQTGGASGEITSIIFSESGLPQFYVDENTVNATATLEVVTTETGETYTFELVARAAYDDSGFFTITGNQIAMDNGSTFTPDYENPLDATNANNVYGMDIKATSTSGKTYTRDMAFWINDVTDEGGEVFVTSIAFDNDTQTILVGETVNKAHTFNGGGSTPTNTGVSYFSGSEDELYILTNDGIGLYKGTENYYILADDQTNGVILDEMTVTINPFARKSKVASGTFKTNGGSGKIYVGL